MIKNVWNNALCEPVVVTFNRSLQLDQTIAEFFKIADSGIKLYVLDNASTDNTEALVAEWQLKWPNLIYHKNKYNIGGNANILRAIELSNSKYAWVVGDDDMWHFDYIDQLIHALQYENSDVIRLGWLAEPCSRGLTFNARTLIDKETFFWGSVSMISATIVRRELMVKSLSPAYKNIMNSYPQLVPLFKAIEQRQCHVFTLKNNLMTHTPSKEAAYFFGDLEWYNCWFYTGAFLSNKNIRKKYIAEAVKYMIWPKSGYFKEGVFLLLIAIYFKSMGVSQAKYLFQMLLLGIGWRGRIFIALLSYFLIPTGLARLVRRYYCYKKKKPYLQSPIQDKSRE